jgi:hypothetical protein
MVDIETTSKQAWPKSFSGILRDNIGRGEEDVKEHQETCVGFQVITFYLCASWDLSGEGRVKERIYI